MVCNWLERFLFLDGGHGFHGGVIQIFCCCDGQAALGQNPLGLMDVGPWQTQENTVTTGNNTNDKNWPNKVEPDLPSAPM